jgi:hypothetical protein
MLSSRLDAIVRTHDGTVPSVNESQMAMTSASTSSNIVSSKLTLNGERSHLKTSDVQPVVEGIFLRNGCPASVAREIAEHLIEADLSGVESHGVMRTIQSAAQYKSGCLKSDATGNALI